MRHTKPVYRNMLDVQDVLEYTRTMGRNRQLTNREVTINLTMLIALSNASGPSEIWVFTMDNVCSDDCVIRIKLTNSQQTRKQVYSPSKIMIRKNEEDSLCSIRLLDEYMCRKEAWRDDGLNYLPPTISIVPLKSLVAM